MKSDLPIMGVAACGTCGAHLQVVCPNGHDPEPIEFNAPGLKRNTVQRIKRGLEKFVPGAAADVVDIMYESPACQHFSDVKTKRAYRLRDRVCACGGTFTPSRRSQVQCTPACTGAPA